MSNLLAIGNDQLKPDYGASTWNVNALKIQETSAVKKWITGIQITLFGYGLFGRGFAYLGVGKLYVGELLLCWGLLSIGPVRIVKTLRATRIRYTLVAFFLWNTIVALFFSHGDPLERVRDSMIWGYAIYALLVASVTTALINPRDQLSRITTSFAKWFVLLALPLWSVFHFFHDRIPHWPGTSVEVIYIKSSDYLVLLASIAIATAMKLTRLSRYYLILFSVELLVFASISRGGLLAFIASILVCFVKKNSRAFLWKPILLTTMMLIIAVALDIQVPSSYGGRSVSGSQLISNFVSAFNDSDREGGLQENKDWRMQWWNDIIDYTFNGPYFWTGKGYGINLADDDGYQVAEDGSLRSPHNSHLTFLARAGVPGLILWIALQIQWFASMIRAYITAEKISPEISGVFLWLIGTWIAFLVNAAFDPSLEGPMAAVWFWSIFGCGIGLTLISKRKYPHNNLVHTSPQLRCQEF